jgi:autotransporter-associated beta strand protein
MKKLIKGVLIVTGISTPALAQTTINGSSMTLQSSGTASGTGWTLSSDGYLGTYITLSQPTAVSLTLNAAGTASNGLSADMMVSIADSNNTFNVATSTLTNYNYTTPTLPAGTYLVKTQLDNQTSTQTPSLTLGSLTVSGTGVSVSNQNTTTNALNSATTYATNFRQGPGNITLSNPVNGLHLGAGTQVQVKLISNAFNFAAAVYGNSPFSGDTQWINVGANGTNLPASTSEQINYQKAVTSNFNMIVPANAGKWVNNEFTQGSVNMNLVDAMTDFAAQNNLRVRMHNLIWNTEQPTFVNNLFAANGTLTAANKTTLNNAITSRINYYASQNNQPLGTPRADNYTEMDVLNEPYNGQSHQDNYIGSGALGVSGVANVYSQVATAVKNAGANTRLMVNEYNVLQFSPKTISSTGVESGSDPYANWYLNGVQSLKQAGAPIGGIGMELYTNATSNVSPVQMQQAMQNLSVAKDPNGNSMPLSLTEFGVAGGQSPSAANYDADLTTALTMAYGNPQTDTFGYWGGVGGPHDGNGSIYALYDANYNLTSAGQTWQSWMNQYNTNLTLTTDANGNISFNGTYGLYDVIVNGQTYQLNLVKGTSNYGLLTAVQSAVWNGGGADQNFSTSGNWSGTALTANASLAFAGTSNLAPVNNSTAGTQYNGVTFNSGAGAFVVSGNAINLGGDIVNNSGSLQTVNVALALQTNVNLNAASGDLALGGGISGGFALTKIGAHTATLTGSNSYTGGTNVTAGTLIVGAAGALPIGGAVSISGSTSMLQLGAGTGAETLSSLTISGGGKFDLNNNHLFINYTSQDPALTILGYLASGESNSWSGAGIDSSAAFANAAYGIAFGDGADGAAGLASGTIKLSYALYGDLNQDGVVNGTDFGILAANFGKSVTGGWEDGDLNYDGVVNGSDFGLLASNFGDSAQGTAITLPASEWAALDAFAAAHGLLADVPEPSLIAPLIAGSLIRLGRRRRASR